MFRNKNIGSFFFVALFLSYYAGAVLFTHAHIINGATIIHSHFYTKSHQETDSGGHTEHSITLIAQIAQFDCAGFSSFRIPSPPHIQLCEKKVTESFRLEDSLHLQSILLRAPPSMV